VRPYIKKQTLGVFMNDPGYKGLSRPLFYGKKNFLQNLKNVVF